MTVTRTTTDHSEIRRWVEARGGRPGHVADHADGDLPGPLRISFAPHNGVEELPWDAWFEAFDISHLAFVYEDESDSRFNKLVDRVSANGSG